MATKSTIFKANLQIADIDHSYYADHALTLGVTRPDISTQIRFRKEEELRKDEAALRRLRAAAPQGSAAAQANVKILTSCPSCLQGLLRYEDDLAGGLLEADYIVIEMARLILGENWLPDYVARANAGGIERVLV